MRFRTTLQLDGKTATGIHVPDDLVSALNGGNRPQVRVTLGDHTYQTTIARMRGTFMFPVSAAVRAQAGLEAGDEVDVEIHLDTAPREVAIPEALAVALAQEPHAEDAFKKLSYSNRKRHALAVSSAKTEETRQRRIAKALDELRGR